MAWDSTSRYWNLFKWLFCNNVGSPWSQLVTYLALDTLATLLTHLSFKWGKNFHQLSTMRRKWDALVMCSRPLIWAVKLSMSRACGRSKNAVMSQGDFNDPHSNGLDQWYFIIMESLDLSGKILQQLIFGIEKGKGKAQTRFVLVAQKLAERIGSLALTTYR